MKNFHHSELSIQNHIDNLPLAEVCAMKVAELIGFNDHDNKQIQLALEEALSNIIKHSYAPGQLDDLKIEFLQVPLGLKLSIWVKGIPFDPELFPVYSQKKLVKDYDDRGLGIYLIKKIADDYAYINHGHQGIEVIISKNLSSISIEDMIQGGEAEELGKFAESGGPKPAFTIGPMKPEEAVGVSRLAYYAYGYTYPYENIYYPDKVARLNKSGHMISYLARLEGGEIIGHSAIEKKELSDTNVEIGIAFSNPAYRGMGIMNRIWESLIDRAIEEKLTSIFAMCVTTHPFSQKGAHHFNLTDCSLLLSRVPVLKFKDIQEGAHPRESIMIAYRYLHPPKSLTIYPPPTHKTMIKKIYHELDYEPELEETSLGKIDLIKKHSSLSVNPDMTFIVATIQVEQYGEHILPAVEGDLKRLCIQRFETIYLKLPLESPYTALLCKDFEKLGFFFSGIHPGKEGDNFLVLQYLNNQVMDYSVLDLDSDFGKELAAYVKNCDPNSQA